VKYIFSLVLIIAIFFGYWLYVTSIESDEISDPKASSQILKSVQKNGDRPNVIQFQNTKEEMEPSRFIEENSNQEIPVEDSLDQKERKPDNENVSSQMTDAEVIDISSDLYRELLEDYQIEKFLAKKVGDKEFVIAREHPHGKIVFTKHNEDLAKFASEDPEGYFQFVRQNISELAENEESDPENKYEFLESLYNLSAALNIDIISTYCNESRCYFEALYLSLEEADRLLWKLEEDSNSYIVITAVFSNIDKSFVSTAYFN
jgi:hypothetical protein